MPIGKIAAELVEKLGAEATTETARIAPKVAKPTPARTPTKGVEPEQVIIDRLDDIKKDAQRAGFEYQKQVVKEKELNIDNPAIPGQATITKEVEQAQNALYDKKRNLYLKALTLKKEEELTNIMKTNKAKGVSGFDTVLDQVSIKLGRGQPFSNIEARTGAIYNKVSAPMHDLKDSLRTKWIGLSQDTDLADEVIRYLKDGKVKDSANSSAVKTIAKQWEDAANTLKSLRNKAGARIGTLEDWVLPQSHDKLKMVKAGYDEWVKFIKPRLDTARIETEQQGNIDEILKNAFTNITAREAVRTPGKPQLAKAGEAERILHFSDGEGMIEYKNMFGNPDVFATMDAHVRQQSNEIATLQLFGPNPERNFEKMKELARADGMGSVAEGHLDRVWTVATGQADGNDIVSTFDNVVAQVGGGHRAIQVASKLGSATITSLADLSTMIIGAGYRGLSSVKMMGKSLDTLLQEAVLVGKVGKNTELASRMGVVSEFASASLANSRYAEVASGFMQRRAENVIRASGLGAWTNSLRVGFGLELTGKMFDDFGKKFDDLQYKKMFEEYGFTSKDWDLIRSTQAFEIQSKANKGKPAKFLNIEAVSAKDEELGFRLSEMITTEMDSFVIMPTDRVRAFTTAGMKKGTLGGETARNIALFKSFPITLTMLHINRFGAMNTPTKVGYAAAVIAANTILGSVALWAYDVATGKTPRDLNRKAMIPEALTKGGGLGIFGDILLGEDKSRYGHSWASTVMGVPASTLEDVAKTAYEAATLNEKFVPNTYNRAKAYIPGQNLWYTRLLMERTLGDTVGNIIDPERQRKIRRREKALRLRGQESLFR